MTTLGALPKSVSLFDEAGLIHAFTGHDAIVNLATAIPSTPKFMSKAAWSENDRIRSDGSKVLVDAALKAGIPTVIQESVSVIYRDRSDEWIDEQWPTDRFPMSLGNHAAEASANHFTQLGGAGIILRFGWFYGPGAAHSEEFFRLAQRYGIGVMMGACQYVCKLNSTGRWWVCLVLNSTPAENARRDRAETFAGPTAIG